MINKLTDVQRRFEMEINVEEIKVMRISRQTFTVQIMMD